MSNPSVRRWLHAPWMPASPWRAPATWSWLVLITIIHAGVAAGGGPAALTNVYQHLGLSRSGFLTGEPWQVASYGLLHGSWAHLTLNAALLLAIGGRIEGITGARVMVRVTLAGIMAGGLAHLCLGEGILVGLSGGCVALLLLLATLSPQSRMLPVPVSARSLGRGILLAALLLALINPSLGLPGASWIGQWIAGHGGASWFHVSHACHLGGGLAGWFCGRWILRPRVTLAQLQRDRAKREHQHML